MKWLLLLWLPMGGPEAVGIFTSLEMCEGVLAKQERASAGFCAPMNPDRLVSDVIVWEGAER